jgi:hypothetical protein
MGAASTMHDQSRQKEDLMRALVGIFCAGAVAGCAASDGARDARISVLITDAPGPDIRAAVVTIDRVYLQSEAGRVTLRDAPFTGDLIRLSDDVATLVDGASLPAGSYEQLRFVISGAYIEVAQGDTTAIYATPGYTQVPTDRPIAGTLRTPSLDTSGLKVTLPGDAVEIEGEQRVLVVDFDVAESFGQQTGSGDWVMHPVMRAQDFVATGSITIVADVRGVVLPGPVAFQLNDATGYSEGMHLVTDDDRDGDLETTFMFLDPRQGPFSLTLNGYVTDPVGPVQIALGSGEEARLDLRVVSVVPQ